MNTYRDLFYPERNALTNGEEIRHTYCLHALNHVLKANAQVLSNNAKRRDQKPGTDNDDYRDQGLTRPKVRELFYHDSPIPTLAVRPGCINILVVYPELLLLLLSHMTCSWACVFPHPLYRAWKSSAMARANTLREAVSAGLLASLFLCWAMNLFSLSPYHYTLTRRLFLLPFLNLLVQKGASTSVFSISAGSVGCHPMWHVPEIFFVLRHL